MLLNYLKTAVRNLARGKTFTLVNICGLSVGIASFLIIFLVVQFETSFDDFHHNKDRLFRLVSVPYPGAEGFSPGPGVPIPVAEALRLDYPWLEKVAAIFARDGLITVEATGKFPPKKFTETGSIYFAEPSFFDMFDFEWLDGTPNKSLSNPNSAVLTRGTAEKYFGNWKSALGKRIKYENKFVFQVTGILKNIPANSDFPLGVVLPYSDLRKMNIDFTDWVGTYGRGFCFIKLPREISENKFDQDLHEFVKKHKPVNHAREGIRLQPLSDMHFDAAFGNFTGRIFSKSLVRTLWMIGIFLLLLACVNYVNLMTAQSVTRSKEVGIRKVLGGSRYQLVLQFLLESFLLTITSVILALGIAKITLPYLNQLLDIPIKLNGQDPEVILFLVILTLTVTILSGLYPAVASSRFNPAIALKAKFAGKSLSSTIIRRGLVVMQFGIAQFLMICVLVMTGQVNYFRSAPLGFDQMSVISVPVPNDSSSLTRMDKVRNELLKQPGILAVSFSTFSPLDNDIWNNRFRFDHSPDMTNFITYFKWADASYFKTYQLEFVAGRPYPQSDTVMEYVVNETLVRKLGLNKPEDILGKEINFWNQEKGPVVGVVRDFNTNSLQTPIVPVVMACWKDAYQVVGIRIIPGKRTQALGSIERIWNSAYPDNVFEYQFLDDKINAYYRDESRLSILYQIFSGIALLISCLGLFGLVSFMAVRKIKELGIRKVLGASISDILYLFSREFTVLVIISFFLEAPLAYLFMDQWLSQFSFRIQPGIPFFLVTLAGSLVLALLTVGYRSWSAARSNPVVTLRNE